MVEVSRETAGQDKSRSLAVQGVVLRWRFVFAAADGIRLQWESDQSAGPLSCVADGSWQMLMGVWLTTTYPE